MNLNHSYRVERLCMGHCDTGEATHLNEKAVVQAFATLAMGVEQLLAGMPHSVSTLTTRYTQDGLDIRVASLWDSATVRHLVASVVSDVNTSSPGLNLSVISRPAAAGARVQSIAVLPSEQIDGFGLPAPVAEEDALIPLHMSAAAAASHGAVDCASLRLAA